MCYVLYLCSFHVCNVDLFSFRIWIKELITLDKVANCELVCPTNLALISKHWYLRSRWRVYENRACADCYVLPG
ncbi:hypothetical protein AADW59_00580 [Candidatus Hodgkinia cicadicola]